MKTMSYREFKRRVFNAALMECFTRFTLRCCGDGQMDDTYDKAKFTEIATGMTKDFYQNVINLNEKTIKETKQCCSEAVTFIKDCIAVSETIAEEKANDAEEEHLEIPEDQDIELSKEDQEVIDVLYDDKEPTVQIDAVRDATVKALIAEDRKAQEIKDAVNIANAMAEEEEKNEENEEKSDIVQETMNRIEARGPHSLMHAILNSFSNAAFRAVSENTTGNVNIGNVMRNNAADIKNRSIIMYSLFESASVLGIKEFTPMEVKRIAEELYYG